MYDKTPVSWSYTNGTRLSFLTLVLQNAVKLKERELDASNKEIMTFISRMLLEVEQFDERSSQVQDILFIVAIQCQTEYVIEYQGMLTTNETLKLWSEFEHRMRPCWYGLETHRSLMELKTRLPAHVYSDFTEHHRKKSRLAQNYRTYFIHQVVLVMNENKWLLPELVAIVADCYVQK
jgi:hypothetical protein